MADLSKLSQAVTDMGVSVDAAVVAMAAHSPVDQAIVDAITVQVSAQKAKLDAAVAPTPAA